ncbi:MAG TPA: tetratricopeptide repeat protein [Xanthomonadaceae bacterium]|jgi:tetratricopeptide (TPR) repeat protein
MLQDVIEALRRQSPDAVALAQAEVDATPANAETHHLLGIARRYQGDLEGARASFDKAIELAPDEAVYHLSRAMLARTEGDLSLVDRASARSIALDPNLFDAYLLRIQLAIALGDFAEAERQIEMAEKADRENSELIYLAGQVALLKGEGDRAVKLLNAAVAEQPRNAQMLATLGSAYQQQGHSAFAEQSLRRALELDPGQTRWRRLLVETLVSQNRNEEAEAELATYRRHHPQELGGLVLQGEMRLRAGNPAAALADFRAVLKQSPREPRVLAGLQDALLAIADPALARGAWEGVLQDEPGLDQIWMTRLSVSADDRDYDEVLRRWSEALPTSTAALLHQARRHGYQGRDGEAEAGYDALLARLPTYYEALLGKAVIALHRDPAEAVTRLDALLAQALPPQAAFVRGLRGLAHDRMNQPEQAFADWRQGRSAFGLHPIAPALPADVAKALVADLPPASGTPVVMLWGPPGSGSERIAFNLRSAAGRPLLQATNNAPRMPQYPERFVALAADPAGLPGVVDEIRPVYAKMLAPHLAQGQQGVFDWLAQWDARMTPALRHALPGTRLIAVLRDPRDMLLNWLACGSPAMLMFVDPVAAARWLAGQLEHLLVSRDELGLPVLIVDMDQFEAGPDEAMKDVAEFAALSSPPESRPAMQMLTDSWRLPTRLPVGRWRAYRQPLAEAFEVLAPLVERLGYPRA